MKLKNAAIGAGLLATFCFAATQAVKEIKAEQDKPYPEWSAIHNPAAWQGPVNPQN